MAIKAKAMVAMVAACAGVGCAGLGGAPGAQGPQERAPAWAQGLPAGFRYGGASGRACWAIKVGKGALLVPAHCLPPGSGEGSEQRDYRLLALPDLPGEGIGARRWPSRSAPVGSSAWVAAGGSWREVSVASAAGSSYWLAGADGALFCPGDSGAAVWASQGERMVWLGMVVSGGAASGCSPMATAVKAQAIDLAGAGSERF